MIWVVKLGGSVITHKGQPETVDDSALETAVEAVARVDPAGLVLVHGGGSFGHVHADRHNITRTDGSRNGAHVWAVHAAMTRLNAIVIDRLQSHSVPAVPVHPFSAGVRDTTGALEFPTGPIEHMLDEGFVPVLHGDVIVHAGRGATIVSGDTLVVELAKTLRATRVGLCTREPGILDANGQVVRRVGSFDDVKALLHGTDGTDVTGGMAGKVKALLELDAPSSVFGLEDLGGFLAGETPGTLIDPHPE